MFNQINRSKVTAEQQAELAERSLQAEQLVRDLYAAQVAAAEAAQADTDNLSFDELVELQERAIQAEADHVAISCALASPLLSSRFAMKSRRTLYNNLVAMQSYNVQCAQIEVMRLKLALAERQYEGVPEAMGELAENITLDLADNEVTDWQCARAVSMVSLSAAA